ncbi:MAG: hypothetical protein HQM04_05020 [Magnetococcales bacterium]|nr:hypothetical protein [Magnetococcales bacterium]MBF0114387.1 hypothetical protein [Magnetococcales bacterium]
MSTPTRPAQQGTITLLAILILLLVAVLAGSMGWLHLRSQDIADEWLNRPGFVQRSLDKLLEVGKREAYQRFNQQCAQPTPSQFTLNIAGWGTVSVSYLPRDGNDNYPVTLQGSQTGSSRTIQCVNPCRNQNTPENEATTGAGLLTGCVVL